jgi:hypothetical protein
MLGLNNVRRPESDPAFASFLVVAGGVILGLWVGEGIFALAYGRRMSAALEPWWYSLFFIVSTIAAIARSEGRMFRVALGLFGLRFMIAFGEATILRGDYQPTHEMLLVASAIAFVVAGWAAARPWAKIAGCIAFLVVSPAKYKMLESITGARSVVGATESVCPSSDPNPEWFETPVA